MNEVEKIILENTPEEYKYIARDKGGDLFLYTQKPSKGLWYKYWETDRNYIPLYIYNHLFQNIKWTDEEPLRFRNEKGEFLL